MTVLKNKNHKQWKQAQARISVSPLANRISRLAPQGKAAAVGLAFGESVFLRKLLMPILVGGFSQSLLKKFSLLTYLISSSL